MRHGGNVMLSDCVDCCAAEDRPNPLYRRICYTTAWGEVVAFAVLNIAGLTWAVISGQWQLRRQR